MEPELPSLIHYYRKIPLHFLSFPFFFEAGSDLEKRHIGRRNHLSTATQLAIPLRIGLSTHYFLGGF